MLQLTKRLQEGISLINVTDTAKMNGVLGRVCTALAANRSQVFTEEEEEKLSSSIGFSLDQTKLLIQTVVHIIQQAAHGMVRPALLGEHLASAGINQEIVGIFTDQWSTNAKPIVDRLRQQSLSQKQLEDIAWDLHLETASSSRSRQSRPIVHLQLNLGSGSPSSGTLPSEKVVMQFDQDQLYNLYNQLEEIQTHLDALR